MSSEDNKDNPSKLPLDSKGLPPEILEKISDVEEGKIAVIVSADRSEYSGPVPSPDMLREYEDILPGAADRLISLTENEQRNRNRTNIGNLIVDALRIIASVIVQVLFVVGGAYYMINGDLPIYGVWFGVGGIVAGIIGFALRQFMSRDE